MRFPLVGNERLETVTGKFIQNDIFPHALIIEGNKGSGRHTLAKYLAKAATCIGEEKPCENCKSCALCDANTHPDIEVVEPPKDKKSITVDRIREVRQNVFVKAHISNKRVFIIDRAETMNPQAQNALLKVLEEPPQGVIFILIVPSREMLLETIISRCITLSVAEPDRKTAEEYIARTHKADTQKIREALRLSSGSIGRALEILGKSRKKDDHIDKAEEFIGYFKEGKEWEMLKLLSTFEKDRPATDLFISALKTQVAKHTRNSTTVYAARRFNRFYEELCSFEELLKTNINLALLFSAIVATAKQLND